MSKSLTLSDAAMDVLRRSTRDGDALCLPPETLARPLYVEVNKAIEAPGGILVSVAPSSVQFSTAKNVLKLRESIELYGEIVLLPEGSFKASGTMVNTVIVKMRKPSPA